MNSLIICLLLVTSPHVDSVCKEQFYRTAFEDTTFVSSKFLKLKVTDSAGNNKLVLLPNRNMYVFLRDKGIKYELYQEIMRSLYNSNVGLKYSDYGGLPSCVALKNDKYVKRIAKKGEKVFINHFFKNDKFKFKYIDHLEPVISEMFDYGVLVSYIDNGLIAIRYKAACL